MEKKLWFLLRILSLAGMFITVYLIFQHFADPGESACNISEYVNCDIVNKSIYAEILGIPVSILGFIAYAFFFVLTFLESSRKLLLLGTFASLGGLLFSLYLTYIEFFVLNAICIFCVTQQILILIIFIIFLTLWRRHLKS